ncbi:tyramine N-methyltransferase [Sarracenia purpurea var. burkii]
MNIVLWPTLLLRLSGYDGFSLNLGVSSASSTSLYCDNKSVVQMTHNFMFHEHTKHIQTSCHYIRHHLQLGTISLPCVSSALQLADLWLKSRTATRFQFLLDKLSLLFGLKS